jgi:hypothetical protein
MNLFILNKFIGEINIFQDYHRFSIGFRQKTRTEDLFYVTK